MAKTSGGHSFNTRNKGIVIAVNTNGNRISTAKATVIKSNATSIKDMQNRDMQKEIQQAISRFHAVMGVRERVIMLAPMDGAYGATYVGADGSHGIYLNSKYFDVPKKEFEQRYAGDNYARRHGFKNTTRKPAQHTVTHELAHATWTSNYTSAKHKAAGKEIKSLYNEFMNDKSSSRKKNYGAYGTTNADEFWAEIITKAVHGDNDRYTRRALRIAKKYQL